MPDVSVLLPCYNASETLEETLISLQKQTYPDFEVICVDDGSTDDTNDLLKDWCRDDPRFINIPIDHSGVIEAANTGLSFCRGEIVVRMDADDRCHPDRIKLQRDYLLKNPEVAAVGSLVKGFPEDQIGEGFQLYYDWLNSLVTHEDITREIFVESPIANPCAAFRRSWIRDLGGYQDYGWPEDYDLWLRFYLAGARFAKIPEVLLEWREHPDRLTHQDSRYSVENFLRAKAHYIAKGPALGRDAVFVWGAGMTGRRLSKHLVREGLPLTVFVEVDGKKIGNTRRGKPIIGVGDLMREWKKYKNPILLTAVRARSAAPLIKASLDELEMIEGQDWWRAA
ncbi:MAG: glycosyl transferase [Chloroflexota bacterium]|nr:MAG: glycosyl transferase [Chloroflexota bacterium]